MEAVVRSLILKGFRSLSDVRIEFDNPTFLVGRNGAGKSNIGDALAFISEAMSSPLRDVIDRRGGITSVRTQSPDGGRPRKLGFGVVLRLAEWLQYVENLSVEIAGYWASVRYAFEVSPLRNYDFEVSREQCVLHSRTARPAGSTDARTKQSPTSLACPKWSSSRLHLSPCRCLGGFYHLRASSRV